MLSAPAFYIQWHFEKNSRPRYAPNGDLARAGDDLSQPGVMEYLWDVVYVTWGCLVVVSIFGEKGWWLWVTIPAYAVYAAAGMANKMRQGFGGGSGLPDEGIEMEGLSKRQSKLEKRGQKVQYR